MTVATFPLDDVLNADFSPAVKDYSEIGTSWRQQWFESIVHRQSNIKERFADLAAEWRAETELHSSIEKIAMHPAYQRIIGMGKDALPFILDDLTRGPDHWFWALCAITGENPVPEEDRGDMEKMAEAWIQWGKEKGYLK